MQNMSQKTEFLKRRKFLAIGALLLLLLNCVLLAQKEEFVAKVVGVHDGDSITVLREDKTQVKIRLEGIDAPELKQAFGNAAKQAMSEMVFGKEVRVVSKGLDIYQRALGDIYVGETFVNLAMIEKGMAWQFWKYNKDPKLKEAQEKAREAKVGLWQDASPVPPWDFRKEKKKAAK